MAYKKEQVLEMINKKCLNTFGCYIKEATNQQVYKSLCLVVKDLLAEKRKGFKDGFEDENGKQVFYMSMEFLVRSYGRRT